MILKNHCIISLIYSICILCNKFLEGLDRFSEKFGRKFDNNFLVATVFYSNNLFKMYKIHKIDNMLNKYILLNTKYI